MGKKNDTKPIEFVNRIKKKTMWINQNKRCIRTTKHVNPLRENSGFAHLRWSIKGNCESMGLVDELWVCLLKSERKSMFYYIDIKKVFRT